MEFAAPLVRLMLYSGATLAIGRASLTTFGEHVVGQSRAVGAALWCGAIALVVAPLALLLLQQHALELPTSELPGLLRETTWGHGWLSLAVCCVLSAMLLPMRRTRITSTLLLVTALGVAAAMGGLGHAAADEQWPLGSRVLDAVHVAGAGAWIGGLLLTVLASSDNRHAWKAEWRAFSRTATVVAPLMLLAGVGSAWRRVGASGPADILATDYGRLLAVKIALALVVLAMGATQRRRLSIGNAPAKRVVFWEVVTAAGVLVVTAWMTGMEPPGA